METPESTLSDHSQMKNSDISSDSSSHKARNYWFSKQVLIDSFFYFKISAWFFGNSVVTSSITGVIWPQQIASVVGDHNKEYWNGVMPVAGTAMNLVMLVVIGYMSDETKTRYGKRRPYILLGTLIMIAFLLSLAPYKDLTYSKGKMIGLMIGYNIGQGMAAGSFSGIIPDIVPAEKVGIASGWLGVTWSLGSLTGTLITGRILNHFYEDPVHVEYWTINGIICGILGLSTLIAIPCLWEDKQDRFGYTGSIKGFFRSLYLPVNIYYDFYWVTLTRFFNQMGVSTIIGYFYYFTLNILNRKGSMDYSIVYAVMIAMSVPASIAGGYLADVFNCKYLVYVSSFIQFVAVCLYILITHHPSWAGMLVIVGLFGVGYGFYQCVDWALALRVLPQRNVGKDMGIWHIAFNLPMVIAPPVISAMFRIQSKKYDNFEDYYRNAYSILFGIAAFYFLMATVFIYPLNIHEAPRKSHKDEESDEKYGTKMEGFESSVNTTTIETK